MQDSCFFEERVSQIKLALPLFAEKNSQNGLFFPFNYVNTHIASRVIYSFFFILKRIPHFFLLVFLAKMQKNQVNLFCEIWLFPMKLFFINLNIVLI